jgi:hypothetical protein
MVSEFGEPGVENQMLLDLVTHDKDRDVVVLAMFERRRWGTAAMQFRQIEEKINRYMAYALDGFLVQHYPQYEGKKVVLRLDCAEAPHGDALVFVNAAQHATRAHGLDFQVNVTAPAS